MIVSLGTRRWYQKEYCHKPAFRRLFLTFLEGGWERQESNLCSRSCLIKATKTKERKVKTVMVKSTKVLVSTVIGILFVMFFASLAMAAEPATGSVDYTKAIVLAASVLAAGLGIGLGAIGAGIGMGQGLGGATTAVGRNPEAQGKVLLTMMVGLAMIESLAIYTLVIALVIIYANPLLKMIQ
jgi:F-type H+-transporting ATPase subunit c